MSQHTQPTEASPEASPEAIRDFFDRQQTSNQYQSLKNQTTMLDREAAAQLNQLVRGDVLTVGGIWDFFHWGPQLQSLTVLDLSPEMLKSYCPPGAKGIIGDLYTHEFPANSFDVVVYPLILHHTPQGGWAECERRIDEAVERARRWLKPNGRLLILEYCPHPAWNPLQRMLLPATRLFLKTFNQPLVVMYTRRFYEKTLNKHFGSCEIQRIAPPGFDYWAWYPIFMSIRWLRMPFAMYPKLHVMSAPASPAPGV